MKTTRTITSAILAVGAPAIALLVIGNILSAETGLAIVASASLLAFALLDYARDLAPVGPRAPILRPALPPRAEKAPVTSAAFVSARRVA